MSEKETIFGQVIAKANNYQAVPDGAGGRRIIKTARLRRYEASFARQCRKYRGRRIDTPFALKAVVYFQTDRNDIDNAIKTLLDCLQDAEAITDDRLCYRLEAEKRTDRYAPRVEYELSPFEPDLGELFRQS